MKKIIIVILVLLTGGCSELNETSNPCGFYDELCLTTTPINQ